MIFFFFYIVIAFCLSIGMVGTFHCGHQCGKKGMTTSDGVWSGYARGIMVSLATYCCLVGVLVLFALFQNEYLFGEALLVLFIGTIVITLSGTVFGLVIFTPIAFFGYSIGKQTYVSGLLEAEANKTDEERLNDLKSQQFSRPHL